MLAPPDFSEAAGLADFSDGGGLADFSDGAFGGKSAAAEGVLSPDVFTGAIVSDGLVSEIPRVYCAAVCKTELLFDAAANS